MRRLIVGLVASPWQARWHSPAQPVRRPTPACIPATDAQHVALTPAGALEGQATFRWQDPATGVRYVGDAFRAAESPRPGRRPMAPGHARPSTPPRAASAGLRRALPGGARLRELRGLPPPGHRTSGPRAGAAGPGDPAHEGGQGRRRVHAIRMPSSTPAASNRKRLAPHRPLAGLVGDQRTCRARSPTSRPVVAMDNLQESTAPTTRATRSPARARRICSRTRKVPALSFGSEGPLARTRVRTRRPRGQEVGVRTGGARKPVFRRQSSSWPGFVHQDFAASGSDAKLQRGGDDRAPVAELLGARGIGTKPLIGLDRALAEHAVHVGGLPARQNGLELPGSEHVRAMTNRGRRASAPGRDHELAPRRGRVPCRRGRSRSHPSRRSWRPAPSPRRPRPAIRKFLEDGLRQVDAFAGIAAQAHAVGAGKPAG